MNRAARFLTTSQGLLAIELVVLMVAGFFVSFWYEPDPGRAYASVKGMVQHAVPAFFLGVQYWGGQLLFLHAFLHVATLLFYGTFNSDWTPRWHLAVATLVVAYVYNATGNFLLFDRHGVQSAVIEVSIVERIPFFGSIFADWIRGGPRIDGATIRLWHLLHLWLVPMLLVGYAALSVFFRRYDDEARPYYGGMAALGLVPLALAALWRVPLGEGAKAADFNAYGATVNWYAWPLHGALRAFEAISPGLGWIGALVLPAAFAAYLFYIPKLCVKVTQVFAQAVFVLACALFLLAGVTFGGWPANPFARNDPPRKEASAGGPALTEADAALYDAGKELFRANGCGSCHGMGGRSSGAGPDLGGIPESPKPLEWYMNWIRNPAKVRPSATMPAFPNLNDQQLRALAVYLVSKKR